MSPSTADPITTTRADTAGAGFAAIVLLVAWGGLAFGAVYPWAYYPLAGGAVVTGLAMLVVARDGLARLPRLLLAALAAVLAGALLQLVPLPNALRLAISPASDAVLRDIDLLYAVQAAAGAAPASRPLTLDPAATGRAILLLASFSVLLAGLIAFFSRHGVAKLATPIVAFGVLLAFLGIVQKAVLGDDAYSGMRIYGFWAPRFALTTPFGPFVNRNHYAGWMLMALPLAVGSLLAMAEHGFRHVRHGWRNRLLWLSSAHGGRLQLAGFAVLLMSVALLMTRSRSGGACLAIAMTIAAVAAFRHLRTARARLLVALTLVVLAGVAFAWADVSGDRFAPRVDDSMRLRRDIWTVATRIAADFPLAGTGLNTFATATLDYQRTRTDMHFAEAHNEYLQLATEGGLLLCVPAAIAFVAVIVTIRRRFAAGRDDRTTYWLRLGATTGLVALALQSLVEFSLQMPGNAVLFVVLLAAALHEMPDHARRAAHGQTPGPSDHR